MFWSLVIFKEDSASGSIPSRYVHVACDGFNHIHIANPRTAAKAPQCLHLLDGIKDALPIEPGRIHASHLHDLPLHMRLHDVCGILLQWVSVAFQPLAPAAGDELMYLYPDVARTVRSGTPRALQGVQGLARVQRMAVAHTLRDM